MISLSKISFPVFQLEKIKPVVEDNKIYYISTSGKINLIDDKSITAQTLGRRRLIINENKQKLYKLHNAIYFLGDLIKITKSSHWYIDNNGTIFEYKKSKVVPLIFRDISQVIPIKTGGAILEIKDIPQRFKCMYMPVDVKYAGLLKISNLEYILYGLYKEKHKDTRRKI